MALSDISINTLLLSQPMWYNPLLMKAVAKGDVMWYLYATHMLRAGQGQGTATDR